MQRIVPLALLLALVSVPVAARSQESGVPVFSRTAGFRHSSIGAGIAAIRKLGQENGFAVDATEDAGAFTSKNLARYRAIVFLNTTGDVLDAAQQGDFERDIQAGGGCVGIHSATDTEYDWPWYGRRGSRRRAGGSTSGLHDVHLIFRNPDAKSDGFLFGLLTATFESVRR